MIESDIQNAAIKVVTSNIADICKVIHNTSKKVSDSVKLEYEQAFDKYIYNAISKYSKCKTLLHRYQPVFLYDVFINLDVSLGDKNISTNTICNLTNISNYIIITGTGGVGKTTLMRHLFLNTIMKTQYIPIFIELRDINSMYDNENIIDLIYSNLKRLGFTLIKESFEKALISGRFTIFFDAFDEVIDEKREKLKRDIEYLVDKYSNNIFVISSRSLDRDIDFIGWVRFTSFKINKLSKSAALKLIDKINYDGNIKEKFLKELDKTLYEEHESFASNPLLLVIMLMTYDQYARIPTKIHLFYQQAYETLYSKHDAVKDGYIRRIESELDIEEFENLLSSFSMLSYVKKSRSFNEKDLLHYIKSAIEIENCKAENYKVKRDMVENTCILMQEGLEYIFSHRTFQEFFAAQYICRIDDDNQKNIFDFIFWNLNSSINEDILMKILMNMQQDRFEKNFIIPYLSKIFEIVDAESEPEQLFNYLNFSYEKICIDPVCQNYMPVENESDYVCFTGFKEGYKYHGLINFIYNEYRQIYPLKIENIQNEKIVEIIKDLGESSIMEDGVWELSLSGLTDEDKEYFITEGLETLNWYKERFIFAKYLLEKLKEKVLTKPSINDLINNLPIPIRN